MSLRAEQPGNGVLVVGEVLADIAPKDWPRSGPFTVSAGPLELVAHPGGSPANVAVGLARMDIPAYFAGRLSADGLGPWLRSHLASNGVDLSQCVAATEPATLALVTLGPQGGATYGFYGPGTADWQWTARQLPPPSSLGLQGLALAAVHTGSLASAWAPGAEVIGNWLGELRAAGDVIISFDPNVRSGLAGDAEQQRRRLLATAAHAHLVKASHEDIEALLPGASAAEAAQGWLGQGALVVLVTQGPGQALAFHRDGPSACATPPPVHLVDTIGAGDAFASGFLAYLHKNKRCSPQQLARLPEDVMADALSFAVLASAITCTRPGADPPTFAQVEAFRASSSQA